MLPVFISPKLKALYPEDWLRFSKWLIQQAYEQAATMPAKGIAQICFETTHGKFAVTIQYGLRIDVDSVDDAPKLGGSPTPIDGKREYLPPVQHD